MALALPTIEEYIIQRDKEFGFWLVFHTRYNDICAFGKHPEDDRFDNFDKKYIDNESRNYFLNFMKENFPTVKLTNVFDLVDPGVLTYPYLGSIAVDCAQGDEAFSAISAIYGNPFEAPISNKAVFWVMKLEDAVKPHTKRREAIDAEFGDF